MGSDNTGDVGSRPAHTVNLEAFYIDKYEVTNEMYDACVYAVECRKPQKLGSAKQVTYFANPVFANYPVLYVDWKMANAYCAWRGARLPTEAEWEKAARGTEERIYPWGEMNLIAALPMMQVVSVIQPKWISTRRGKVRTACTIWRAMSGNGQVVYHIIHTMPRMDGKIQMPEERIARGGSWHVVWRQ